MGKENIITDKDGTGVAAKGIIDEVCFYDRVLSTDAIKILSGNGKLENRFF